MLLTIVLCALVNRFVNAHVPSPVMLLGIFVFGPCCDMQYLVLLTSFAMVTVLDEEERAACFTYALSYDVSSGSEMMPCNKIYKPLVVYRFLGNVMTYIKTSRT